MQAQPFGCIKHVTPQWRLRTKVDDLLYSKTQGVNFSTTVLMAGFTNATGRGRGMEMLLPGPGT